MRYDLGQPGAGRQFERTAWFGLRFESPVL